MKPLLAVCCAVLSAPLALAQWVNNAPDVGVSNSITGYMPLSWSGYTQYDADWTADGRLALVLVDRSSNSIPRTDRVVIALYDPSTATTRCLAAFTAYGWAIEHVSLATPPRNYVVTGTTTPDHDRNRVYVAIGAEAPVQSSLSNGVYLQRVRAVRILSASYTHSNAASTLRVSAPGGITDMAVSHSAEPPRPDVQVYDRDSGYDVECAFVDPRNVFSGGGHVMMTRSSNFGLTFLSTFFVTGPSSLAAQTTSNPLGGSRYARPALAYDVLSKRTVIALGDSVQRVVRVGSAAHGSANFAHVVSTTAPSSASERHHSPRVASRDNTLNVTYRVGTPGGTNPQPIDWFYFKLVGGTQLFSLPRLSSTSTHHADIEIRGSRAHIAIAERLGTGTSTWDTAVRIEIRREDRFAIPDRVRYDDSYIGSFLGCAAVSALTPDGASVTRTGALFLRSGLQFSDVMRGHVYLDL